MEINFEETRKFFEEIREISKKIKEDKDIEKCRKFREEWRQKIFSAALMIEKLEDEKRFGEIEKLEEEFPDEFSAARNQLQWLQAWAK